MTGSHERAGRETTARLRRDLAATPASSTSSRPSRRQCERSVAEWLARRTRDLEVAGSIHDHAMLQLP
ncbi:hypothetical protein ElyMa_003074600 [Elysia marginata]|uniref:Uncharacterized protein n=1 Tax=Elysia marginata TaxID=1093978 RepID=A0AAV4IES3_9GAST|nr:hypothetical protein ElyMa_003074600 [Elysia marginata]